MTTGPIHVGEFVKDEMEARGWSRDLLAYAMTPEPKDEKAIGLNRLALDFMMDCHQPNLFLGREWYEGLSRAFGTSAEMWRNLDYRWQEANGGNVAQFMEREDQQ